jgi:hypothetical protein
LEKHNAKIQKQDARFYKNYTKKTVTSKKAHSGSIRLDGVLPFYNGSTFQKFNKT